MSKLITIGKPQLRDDGFLLVSTVTLNESAKDIKSQRALFEKISQTLKKDIKTIFDKSKVLEFSEFKYDSKENHFTFKSKNKQYEANMSTYQLQAEKTETGIQLTIQQIEAAEGAAFDKFKCVTYVNFDKDGDLVFEDNATVTIDKKFQDKLKIKNVADVWIEHINSISPTILQALQKDTKPSVASSPHSTFAHQDGKEEEKEVAEKVSNLSLSSSS